MSRKSDRLASQTSRTVPTPLNFNLPPEPIEEVRSDIDTSDEDEFNRTMVDPAGTSGNAAATDMQQLFAAITAMNARMEQLQQQLTDSQQAASRDRAVLEQRIAGITEPAGANIVVQPGTSAAAASHASSATGNDPVQQLRHVSSIGAPPTGSSSNMLHKLYDLPEFSGRPEQWPVFAAAFRQSTQEFGYSALQNNFRLQKCLKGDARECVEFLLINPNNVDELISTLEFRFGRPEMLAQSQLAKVRELPVIYERNMDQIVPFSTRVTNMVAFLNTDESKHVLSETTLLAELVSKLPPTKRLDWMQHSMNIQPRATVLDFSIWLRTIAQCVSMLNSQLSSQSSTAPVPNRPTGTGQPNKYAAKHVMSVAQSNSNSRPKCVVCDRAHGVADCSRFRNAQLAERWRMVRGSRLCICCLRPGHMKQNCNYRRACPVNGCEYEHNELLHEYVPNQRDDRRGAAQRSNESTSAVAAASASADHSAQRAPEAAPERRPNPFDQPSSSGSVYLSSQQTPVDMQPLFRILPVTLYGAKHHVDTYAFFDDGSAMTLLDDQLAKDLQLDGKQGRLNVKWFGQHSSSEPSRHVRLEISGASQRRYDLNNVRTVKDINLPIQSLMTSQLDERLRKLPLVDYSNVQPKILIGLDHCHLGMAQQTRTGSSGGPIAVRTRLGWVAYGAQSCAPHAHVLHVAESERWDHLDRIIREFHTTESFGVKRPEQILESNDDARARRILQSTTVSVGNRYQTGLLWRTDDVNLPNSYDMALSRLATVERKMSRDVEYARLYAQQIESYITKGYARKLTKQELEKRDGRIWYLPHFGVQNINKPGKLRIVFDAAATVDGVSLNSVLLSGPDLNKPLVNILFQFRMRLVGVCADVAEMFHQVEVQPCDRGAQRFLWKASGCDKPDTYEMCVMTFGATCSPTSAQFVKNTNALKYEAEFPIASKAVCDLHYVDDFVASFTSEEEAIKITGEVVEIHKRGGFNLRGFISNSTTVLSRLGGERDRNGDVSMELDKDATDKILGLRWCTANDTFVFAMRFDRVDTDVMLAVRKPTKRELLSATMSVYDPFGFLADFVLHAKIMIQHLWRAGTAWDETIPEPTYGRWRAWCGEIENIKRFSIPRCYSAKFVCADDLQLHIFADASEEAFAAVGYWRIVSDGRCELAFVAGKVKCAPLKKLSVPRLELQAAVLATRLYTTILECHPGLSLTRTVFWTDSRTVRHWITSINRRFRPFVACRVGEILESTSAECWRWVPTKLNVADDATRSSDRPKYDPDSRWIRGPAFLLQNENNWPTIPVAEDIEENVEYPEEIPTRFVGVIGTRGNNLFDANRFSNLLRLCRACAWAFRFVHNARAKVRGVTKMTGELSAGEVESATEQLCRDAQRDSYPVEYAALDGKQPIERSSALIAMMPYMDDCKLMRLFGRTDAADKEHLPASAQRPILLPRDHPFTALIVKHHHEKMSHQFEDGIICQIRRRYWIPRLRPLVRKIKSACALCKLRAAEPNQPVAGQLPIDRLTPNVAAFSYTGLDYFGPVAVSVGRRQEKRWIALFTCLTTRAVHMEVATDLSTDACLLCIRNFCNLRGVPVRIRSDCGTNFVGADNEIRRTADFIDDDIVQRELSSKGIDWRMNCPGNPEAGGAWERLVQCTKRVLAITLKQISPRVETLRSLVIEAANILNSRPLTHVPVSPNDLEPLTPNHFLLGRTNSTTSVGEMVEPFQIRNKLQWRVHQQLMRHFWKRWVQEYLPELTRRTKYYKDVGPIEVGALVLVCDANQSRGQWLRGRIERVIVGTDGRVRTAEIRTKKGTMRRPVSKLALLDVDVSESR